MTKRSSFISADDGDVSIMQDGGKSQVTVSVSRDTYNWISCRLKKYPYHMCILENERKLVYKVQYEVRHYADWATLPPLLIPLRLLSNCLIFTAYSKEIVYYYPFITLWIFQVTFLQMFLPKLREHLSSPVSSLNLSFLYFTS
jgi:hypothetical protein